MTLTQRVEALEENAHYPQVVFNRADIHQMAGLEYGLIKAKERGDRKDLISLWFGRLCLIGVGFIIGASVAGLFTGLASLLR